MQGTANTYNSVILSNDYILGVTCVRILVCKENENCILNKAIVVKLVV